MSMYFVLGDTVLTSMGRFGDKNKGTVSDKHSSAWPLTCEALGNKQTHCKLLRDTLVTSRHIR